MRFADKTPGGGHILGAECPHKLLTAAAPAARVLGVLQNGGGIRKDLQTPRKADIGGKVVVGRALALIPQGIRLGVQPQPVAVLEARLPQPVFAALAFDKLAPVLHAVVAVLQNALVAVGAVECPGQHGHHIAPERRAVLLVAHNVRHDLRHTDIGPQFTGQVTKPLGHKRHNVLIERRRGAERCHIARPAQTLAALRTVGGDIQKVIPLAPLDVLLQTVHPLVRAGKMTGLYQIRREMARRKLHVLPVLQPLHANIAEAVPCKMRVQRLLAAAQNIGVGRLRPAEVFGVEVAVFVQRFGVAQGKLLPLVTVNFHLDPAGQVLPKVKEVVTVGSSKFLDNRHPLQAADRLVLLPDEGVKAVVKQSGGLRCGGVCRKILRFAIVNFRSLHRTGRAKPASIGTEPFLMPVLIGDAKRCQCGGGVAVVVGLRHKAELALVPAVRQRQRHTVFAAVQRYGAGLVLQTLAIVRPARVEISVIHRLAVDLRLIHTQGGCVETRFFDIALHDKVLIQHRADGAGFVRRVGDPLRLALKRAAVQQACFKPACALGGFAVVVPYRDRPVVLGARGQVGTKVLVQNTLRTRHRAGIPHNIPALHDSQSVGRLHGVLLVAVQLPAKAGLRLVQAQRFAFVFCC